MGMLVISYMIMPYAPLAGAVTYGLLAHVDYKHNRREITDESVKGAAFDSLPQMTLTNYKFSDDFSILQVEPCDCN
jgi:hypothetical protein